MGPAGRGERGAAPAMAEVEWHQPAEAPPGPVRSARPWLRMAVHREVANQEVAMPGTAAVRPTGDQAAGDERLAPAVDRLLTRRDEPGYPRVAFLAAAGGSTGPECVAAWPGELPLVCDVVPLFEQFGLRLATMRPLAGREGADDLAVARLWFAAAQPGWDGAAAGLVEESFPDAAHPGLVGDPFTGLVVTARLGWADVGLLRAAAAYLKQAGLQYSARYVVATLEQHPDFVRALVALFHARLRPGVTGRPEAVDDARRTVEQLMDRATTLDEDQILRGLASFVAATLRTNWYRTGEDGGPRPYRAFKLDPSLLTVRGPVTPFREIFVHGMDVQGVHLRAGQVARGGLRWSDRPEDFRVEVLRLMATQQVKNAIIVPDGAKGAFVVRPGTDPAACYDTFVRGLLDVTDNIVEGRVVAPPDVVTLDGPDPYLVVAADKGTARYSDRANALAQEGGFWLGDAFASGGSTGYDHKAMGITARGAWVAVRRHLSELGLDPDHDEFSVVGVGDMSGDVFGNGMLASRRIRLVGAFDHRHVFLDPEPDAAVSFAERERLSRLPRSSWDDYDRSLISGGGGVWPRSAKQIPLSPAVRRSLGVEAGALSADEVVRAILRAPVDLLWNGGIGTYVKASTESQLDAADPGNDSVRVDAADLRCRAIGEGGNLGLTQRARIEYALNGGRDNGDFIDNAAGVDTSDHEVNIKILLAAPEAEGVLSRADRDAALAGAADEVAATVLDDCARQALAISLAESHAPFLLDRHARLVRHLEQDYDLDRSREVLPSEAELVARTRRQQGLTRPEIAVLLAHSKNVVRTELLASDVPDHPGFADLLRDYFPASLRDRFAEWIPGHRLAREIVATVLANDVINRMGPGFVLRMEERFGAGTPQVALALATVEAVLDLDACWQEVSAVKLPADGQLRVLRRIQDCLERAASWFVRRRGLALDPTAEQERLRASVASVRRHLTALAERTEVDALAAEGLPEGLAREVAALDPLSRLLDAVDTAVRFGLPVTDVVDAARTVDDELELGFLVDALADVPGALHWESMATAVLRDDLDVARRDLLVHALREGAPQEGSAAASPAERVASWFARRAAPLERLRTTAAELKSYSRLDIAMLCTVVAELRLLAQAGPAAAVPASIDRTAR
jgi:glutamate dehydrogenase